MPKMNKFPKTIYVVTENDGGNASEVYFVAADAAAEFAEIGKTRKVAVYKLEGVQAVEGVVKVT
jgi:hypothetical protein